uniref:Uncharacterized protein n=1 Tax=Hemiselmis andersenii TaxID=464988 RepID=A0A6U4NUN6_HEMAN|mmetsp:Transcript_34106/g.83048  ORF Transcript_34106/g.83048 Transcript_34106/m.83048 type:complete len:144 (+) Transcript_34106:240-671(+)
MADAPVEQANVVPDASTLVGQAGTSADVRPPAPGSGATAEKTQGADAAFDELLGIPDEIQPGSPPPSSTPDYTVHHRINEKGEEMFETPRGDGTRTPEGETDEEMDMRIEKAGLHKIASPGNSLVDLDQSYLGKGGESPSGLH